MGGEPYRIAALTPYLGTRRAAGSVIVHRMLHSLAYVLVWLTALGLGFVMLPRGTAPTVVVVLTATVLAGLIALLLFGHRSGVLERVLDGMHRVPVVRRLAPPRAAPCAARRARSPHHDFYHRYPRRFVQAVGLEY